MESLDYAFIAELTYYAYPYTPICNTIYKSTSNVPKLRNIIREEARKRGRDEERKRGSEEERKT